MAVTSSRKSSRSFGTSAAQNGLANVSNPPRIPVGSGVGRGSNCTLCGTNLARRKRTSYSSTVGKYQGINETASPTPRRSSVAISPTVIALTQPWPPNSPTNLPPATRARKAPVTGASGSSFTQCSAALEKTASNSFSNTSDLACGGDHVRRIVDAHHLGTERDQFLSEDSISATQIENALTGLRLEQVQHRLPQRRYEVSVGRIVRGTPILGGRGLGRKGHVTKSLGRK